MVFAWSARFANMRGAAEVECVAERISEQFSRESATKQLPSVGGGGIGGGGIGGGGADGGISGGGV
eukprot:10144498-Lingulodinium_polyedra.AAC.1